jgi:soluble lytic murein transglycosylase
MLNTFDGNVMLAVAAYNAGPGNAAKWRKATPATNPGAFTDAIPFRETRGYVRAVLGNYAAYQSLY